MVQEIKGTESPETDPQIYTQLTFNRGAKQYGGENSLSTGEARTTGYPHEKNNLKIDA